MRPTRLLAAFALLTAACGHDRPNPEPWGRGAAPIIGGSEDDGHAYVIGVGDATQPWCSATLVSAQTVLTAAHCAIGITRVYFGKHLTSAVVADTEVIHPQYNFDTATPDLAMVRLAQPVMMQPAPILRQTLINDPHFIGPAWTFVGFGIDNAQLMSGFGTRRVTTIPVTAIGPTTTVNMEPVTEHYLLYDTMGSSPCYGDSGGPSFFVDFGVEHVGGVASWVGDDFCSSYGAHARSDQPAIDGWIQAMIDQFEGGGPCRSDGSCNEMCNTNEVFDPDCHQFHCAADGVCALACVAPVDPDCSGIDHCGPDGVCDLNCSPPDSDCGGSSSSVATTTATTSVSSSQSSTSTNMSTSSLTSATIASSSATTGGGAGHEGAGGSGGANRIDDRDTMLFSRGCACGSSGAGEGSLGWLALALAGLARRRRDLKPEA